MAEPEVLASGYELTEGPRVDADGRIWFTDALGGGVHRWADGEVETIVPKRRGVGGLALHADGGVLVGGRNLVHVHPDRDDQVVFEPPEGVVGFNDMCATADGSVLVGALRYHPFLGGEPEPGEFWFLRARAGGDASPEMVLDGISLPNGCGPSPDGTTLYACDYGTGEVHALTDGGARVFARTPNGEADGLAVDHEGGVWVALGNGEAIVGYSPDGELRHTVDLPGRFVASLAFDGADAMIVATANSAAHPGAVLRLAAAVPGPIHHSARI